MFEAPTYIYGKLDEEIYMKQPEGFAVKGQEHKVLHSKCALRSWKVALNISIFDCMASVIMSKKALLRYSISKIPKILQICL